MQKILFLFLTTLSFVFANQKADYLLLNSAQQTNILNIYEQRSNQAFLPGTPFRIIDDDYTLSDGITLAKKCTFEGKTYFLVQYDAGFTTIENAIVLNDTIQLVKDGLNLKELNNNSNPLKANSYLKRYFLKGNKTYVLADKFGWVQLKASDWKPVLAQKAEQELFPEKIRLRILSTIETMNQNYRNYFSFFNKHHNKNLPIPQWQTQVDEAQIVLNLDATNYKEQLKNSTLAFQDEINRMLLGTELHCIKQDEQLIILGKR